MVVTTPEVSAVRDADRIIGLLEANEIGSTHLVVNRLRTDMVKEGNMMSSEDVVEILAVDLIGVVRMMKILLFQPIKVSRSLVKTVRQDRHI